MKKPLSPRTMRKHQLEFERRLEAHERLVADAAKSIATQNTPEEMHRALCMIEPAILEEAKWAAVKTLMRRAEGHRQLAEIETDLAIALTRMSPDRPPPPDEVVI